MRLDRISAYRIFHHSGIWLENGVFNRCTACLVCFVLETGYPGRSPFHGAAKPRKISFSSRIKSLWSSKHRSTTVTLWVLWFTVVFSYYGMFLWLPSVMVLKGFDLVKSFQYVLIMSLAQLPGYFTGRLFH